MIALVVIGFIVLAGGAFAAANALLGSSDRKSATAPGDLLTNEGPGSDPVDDEGTPAVDTVELDGNLVDDANGVYVVTSDGQRTKILDHQVSTIVDDGEGGVVYQHPRSGGTGTLRDTRNIRPASDSESVIWHLPAGESEPVIFRRSEFGSDGWLALDGAATDSDGRRLIVYSELDGTRDCVFDAMVWDCADLGSSRAWAEPLGDERIQLFASDHPPSERWMVPGNGAVALLHGQGEDGGILFERLDGSGEVHTQADCGLECVAAFSGIIDPHRWLAVSPHGDGTVSVCSLSDGDRNCDSVDNIRTDPMTHRTVFDGQRGLLHVRALPDGTAEHVYAIDLSGESTSFIEELDSGSRTSFLSAPLIRPTATVEPIFDGSEGPRPEGETAEPEPRRSPTWDEFKDAEIPGFCLHQPTRLVDGIDPNVPDGEGWFELRQTTYTGDPGIVTDLESPDGPLTAVVASCNAGGTGIPSLILFYGDGGMYVASTFLNQGSAAGDFDPNDDWSADWEAAGLRFAGRDGVRSMRADGDVLTVDLDAYTSDDPLATASATAEVKVRVEDGIAHLLGIQRTS